MINRIEAAWKIHHIYLIDKTSDEIYVWGCVRRPILRSFNVQPNHTILWTTQVINEFIHLIRCRFWASWTRKEININIFHSTFPCIVYCGQSIWIYATRTPVASNNCKRVARTCHALPRIGRNKTWHIHARIGTTTQEKREQQNKLHIERHIESIVNCSLRLCLCRCGLWLSNIQTDELD